MTGLFAALEARFNANPTLRLKGRKLYDGLDDAAVNATRPYCEVNYEQSQDLSTFDSDVYEYVLNFRYHAKDLRTNAARLWIDAMRQAFRDSNILSSEFTTCGCRMTRARVPMLANGMYDAEAEFRLTVQGRMPVPLLRHG